MNPVLPVFVGALVLAVSACGHRGMPPMPRDFAVNERQVEVDILKRYDADKAETFSRAALEDGLKRDFALADRDGDGRLDAVETQAENQRVWLAAGPKASPLIDWNQDNRIDFAEFAATARTVFTSLDRDGDGLLITAELRVPEPEKDYTTPRKLR